MGIIMAIVTASCVGWVFLVGMTFSIGSFENQIVAPEVGVALSQIFLDSCGLGVAIFLIMIILGAQFFCGSALTLASSRMVYAFARDGALVSLILLVFFVRKMDRTCCSFVAKKKLTLHSALTLFYE